MQRLLIALLALLLPGIALADSTVHGLATNTTSPLPASSCIYVDQGGTTDTKLCSGWAAALGGLVAASNLSDLTNAGTARTNLGLTSLATTTPGTGEAAAIAAAINSSTGLIGAITPTLNNCVVGNGSAWTSATCPGGGGGGTPGGTSGQIQYNNAGAFGGVTLTAGTPNIVLSGTANSTISDAGATTVADANCGTLTASGTAQVVFTTPFTLARSCTLPAANSMQAGQHIKFVDQGNGTNPAINGSNTATINRAGTDKIAGATSLVMGQGYCAVDLVSDGSANFSVAANSCATVPVAQGGTGITSGTSGGVPYYSSSSAIASSGALTANAPVIGGGAGAAPSVGTRSGNTTTFATTTGTLTSGHCAQWDASGNATDSGGACSGGGGGGNFTLVSKQTAGGSTSNLAWTAVSSASSFEIECRGLSSTTDEDLLLQFGSGGSTWTITSYQYGGTYESAGGAAGAATSSSAAGIKLGSLGSGTNGTLQATVQIANFTLASTIKTATSIAIGGVGGSWYWLSAGGVYSGGTGAFTDVRVITSTGDNLASGGYCSLYAKS